MVAEFCGFVSTDGIVWVYTRDENSPSVVFCGRVAGYA